MNVQPEMGVKYIHTQNRGLYVGILGEDNNQSWELQFEFRDNRQMVGMKEVGAGRWAMLCQSAQTRRVRVPDLHLLASLKNSYSPLNFNSVSSSS